MFCVSEQLIKVYKLASLSFAIGVSYHGMIEMAFLLVPPKDVFTGADVKGRAVAEEGEGGEVFIMQLAGPAITSGAEHYIRNMLRELVDQLNKDSKEEDSDIHDPY